MRTHRLLTVAALAAAVVACDRGDNPHMPPGRRLPAMQDINTMPVGRVPGLAVNTEAVTIKDPYDGNPAAIKSGQALFVQMNCVGCHGYDAKGGMGPDLTDRYWRFGGTDAQIFASIYQGRSQGMPAWGALLPPDEIWRMVAYIRSLGGEVQPQFGTTPEGDLLTGAETTLKGRATSEPF